MLLLSLGFMLMPFAFMDSLVGKRTKKVIITLFCILFIILGGIRWATGTDWLAYLWGFEAATSYYNATQSAMAYEWGFGMLNYLVNITFGSYTVFLFIFTFLKIYLKGKVIVNDRFLNYGLFTLFLYYCYADADILNTRQMLAASFTFFSTFYIIERKLYKFLICVILATLIHRTAFVFVFAYFVFNINFKRQTLLLMFLASMIVGLVLFQFDVSRYFINIPFLGSFSKLQEKLETYATTGQVSYGQIDTTTTIVLGYIKKLFVVLPMLLYYDAFKKDRVYRGILNMLVIGSVVYFILGAVAAEFKRLNGYFDIYEILLIPFWIYNLKQQKTKYIVLFLYVTYAFFRLYSSLYTFWDEIDPFYTIFDWHINRSFK